MAWLLQSPPLPSHIHTPTSFYSRFRCSPQNFALFQQKPGIPRRHARACALRTSSSEAGGVIGTQGTYSSNPLKKRPIVSEVVGHLDKEAKCDFQKEENKNERWIEGGDQILEDTVRLVEIVKRILHSRRYRNGDRLSPEHERTILQKLLPFHPHFETKIGCGVNHITVGNHPGFQSSRCFFIVRKDGQLVDFSYWKCIKGLMKKKHPCMTV